MGNDIYEPSYTIKSFCAAEAISEPTYYKLKEFGLGPDELIPLPHQSELTM